MDYVKSKGKWYFTQILLRVYCQDYNIEWWVYCVEQEQYLILKKKVTDYFLTWLKVIGLN